MIEKAIAIIVDDEGRVILQKRDETRWGFFGGEVEEGEIPEEALVRELREELGVEVTEFAFFRKFEMPGKLLHVFIVPLRWDIEILKDQQREGLDLEVFGRDEMPEGLYEYDKTTLNKFFKK